LECRWSGQTIRSDDRAREAKTVRNEYLLNQANMRIEELTQDLAASRFAPRCVLWAEQARPGYDS
jgi:hypothetical protein